MDVREFASVGQLLGERLTLITSMASLAVAMVVVEAMVVE